MKIKQASKQSQINMTSKHLSKDMRMSHATQV